MRSLALSLLLLCAQAAQAQQNAIGDVPPFPYENQGPFVQFPARITSTPVYQIGFWAAAFVCLPASIYQGSYDQEKVDPHKEASFVCGRALGTALGWPVYAATGLPFFILKSLFWDAPRAAFGHKPKAAPQPQP